MCDQLAANEKALQSLLLELTTPGGAEKYQGMFRIPYCAEHGDEMHRCCGTDTADLTRELGIDNSPVVEEVVCRADEIGPGERKQVELRGRQILIVNDQGAFRAINALCSHYNYPLITGQVSNGTIRCPLHGACFNLKTGDIEDYPGFDSLHPFEVKKVGDNLVIRTTEKRLQGDRRTRKTWIKAANKDKPIVVVGSGPAGESVVENLRLSACKSPIIMLTKENIPPYDRVLLSKRMDIDAVRMRPDEYYKDNMIEVRCDAKVVSFDAAAHSVKLADGSSIEYSKLILALGGGARKMTNPGNHLKGIHNLRTNKNARLIWKNSKGKDVVCVGASFIGMEAAACVSLHAKSVTVVCSTEEPLPALGTDVGAAFRKYFATKNIKVITKARVDSIIGDSGDKVKEVLLTTGEKLPAGMVIAGIGIEPATKWLEKYGVALDSRGFILVNSKFETNLRDVFAVGDATAPPLPFWSLDHYNIQHFQTAQKHGMLAAWAIMGRKHSVEIIPLFWTLYFMERGCVFAGCAEGFDSTIVHGDIDGFLFTKYFIKGDKVVAVAVAGGKPAAIQFLFLCEQGYRLSRKEVEESSTDDWAHLMHK